MAVTGGVEWRHRRESRSFRFPGFPQGSLRVRARSGKLGSRCVAVGPLAAYLAPRDPREPQWGLEALCGPHALPGAPLLPLGLPMEGARASWKAPLAPNPVGARCPWGSSRRWRPKVARPQGGHFSLSLVACRGATASTAPRAQKVRLAWVPTGDKRQATSHRCRRAERPASAGPSVGRPRVANGHQ